jgi:sugar lactone lactonase YvrE
VTEQALYWVDLASPQCFKYVPSTGETRRIQLDRPVGCLAFCAAGGLLMADSQGFALWNDDKLTRLKTDLDNTFTARFNDGAVDRAGRFWVGTASNQPVNSLYRLDADGSIHIMETGLTISNGIGWSPDNRTMYYADSGGQGIVYAYDFELETGSLYNRRVFLPPTGTAAVADGLTVDSAGFVWIAFWDGWRVCRYDPAGRLAQTLDMPVQRPTSCTFGGPELNELYVTSASQGVDSGAQPLAGSLIRVELAVRGLAETLASFPVNT